MQLWHSQLALHLLILRAHRQPPIFHWPTLEGHNGPEASHGALEISRDNTMARTPLLTGLLQ
jgi:hypothetical protein